MIARERERKSIESKILICRFRPLTLSQWGVQFISGQIRKQETPIMNHIDDNDATMQLVSPPTIVIMDVSQK